MKKLLIIFLVLSFAQVNKSDAKNNSEPEMTTKCNSWYCIPIPLGEYRARLEFVHSSTGQILVEEAIGNDEGKCNTKKREMLEDITRGHVVPPNSGHGYYIWYWKPHNIGDCIFHSLL